MPKVEAAAHRKRHRPTPIPKPRFETLRGDDRHNYEFDRHDQTLRVAWSGGQTFIPSSEVKQLHHFLNRIYEPSERTTTRYILTRRGRPQRTEHQANPLPVTTASETSKKTEVVFQEYNGWPNYPSWSVFTVMSSYENSYEDLQRIASQQPGGMGGVRRAVLWSIEQWKNDTPTPYAEVARILVQDFVMNGIRKVEWTPVYDRLRGERQELGEVNPLTALTYDLLSRTDWKSVVVEAEYLTQADDLLRGWVEDQCMTWIERPEARKHTGSVGKFAETVLETYFQAVQWENVTNAFRSK